MKIFIIFLKLYSVGKKVSAGKFLIKVVHCQRTVINQK